ncbi:MAG: aldolase/citrate lyase family protein [Spirochaetales bacterium]|nr:aldolase/citrate lyase family protein [Spirochaetales bacterium]
MAVAKLKEGTRAVGTMIRFVRNPAIAWMIKNAGLDFYMYDMEHGPYSMETLSDSFAVARAAGVGGFVRVPELSKGYISRALDAGAVGVMVPMVESVEQAQRLVEWAKFAPVGKRGFGSNGGHTYYRAPDGGTLEFLTTANREVLTIAQIETADGVAAVEEIAAVEGIDALLVGPNDLALSLGVAGDLMGETLHTAIGRVAEGARKSGKVFGLHAPDALLERWIPEGCTLVMSALDAGILVGGFNEIARKYT